MWKINPGNNCGLARCFECDCGAIISLHILDDLFCPGCFAPTMIWEIKFEDADRKRIAEIAEMFRR